jgi:hypothetical protein
MLYRKTIAVCFEIRTKHINTLRGQNVEFLAVKLGGTYSNEWALKGLEGTPPTQNICAEKNINGITFES